MDIRDRNKALTAEDLIRRYNLEKLAIDRRQIKQIQEDLYKQDNIITDFVNVVLASTEDLTNQVNLDITTWFFSGTPTLENEPAVNWDNKENYIGNLYYDKDTGFAYQFVLNNGDYSWTQITDSKLIEVLAVANGAPDTTDGKRTIYSQEPYTPYEVGDIWINNNQIYRCRAKRTEGEYKEVDWVPSIEYSNDDYFKNVEAVLNQFETYVETNYATKELLEVEKNQITAMVESTTTEKINASTEALIESITEVINRVNVLETDKEFIIERIRQEIVNGVTKVDTKTGYIFDENGMLVDKTNSPTKGMFNDAGMEIINKIATAMSTVFYSGYVNEALAEKIDALSSFVGQTITYADNLMVKNYAIFGSHSRIEDFTENGIEKTGMFPIGEENQ